MKRSWLSCVCAITLATNAWSQGLLVDDEFLVGFGVPEYLDILANDRLPIGAKILSVTFDPASIANTLYGFGSSQGTMIFINNSQFFESAEITYVVSYYAGGAITKDSAVVSIRASTGTKDNRPPNAMDDFYFVAQNTTQLFSPLDNDSDPEGETLSLISLGSITNGTAVIYGDQIEFTPATNFEGSAAVEYSIKDEYGNSAHATLFVQVESTAPNTPPLARDDEIKLAPGQTLIVDVMENDIDPDGDTLYISALTDRVAELQAKITNDRLSITAREDFSETANITYRVSDGEDESSEATIRVVPDLPNQAPVANDDSATIGGESSIRIQPLANDTDAEDGVPRLARVISVSEGTAFISGSEIVFTSPGGLFGSAIIVYEVEDSDGATDEANISIAQVTNVPPIARDDKVSVINGRNIVISPLENDEDESPSTLSVELVSSVDNGTLIQSGNNFVYKSNSEFSGNDNFDYRIRDDIGQTSIASVNIVVYENYPPIAVNDFTNTAIDSPVSINVLSNDIDANADRFNIISVKSSMSGGKFSLVGENEILFEPSPGFSGLVQGEYIIADPSGEKASANVRVRVHENIPVIREISLINMDSQLIPGVFNSISSGDYGSFNALTNLGDFFGVGSNALSLTLDTIAEINGSGVRQNLVLDGNAISVAAYQSSFSDLSSASVSVINSPKYLLKSDVSPVSGNFNSDEVLDVIYMKNFGLQGYEGVSPIVSPLDISGMSSVSSIGSVIPSVQAITALDFNGDGIDDLAIALAGVNSSEPAKVRILFGPVLPFSAAALTDTFGSPNYLDVSGFSVASSLRKPLALVGGDFNNDGFDDLAIGQVDSDRSIADGKGLVAIVWGTNSARQTVSLDDVGVGLDNAGAIFFSSGSSEGSAIGAVLSVGDFNADGVDDIVIGNSLLNAPDPSRQIDTVMVIHGGFSADQNLSVDSLLSTPNAGYYIRKDKLSGTQVRREIIQSVVVSDINNDGYDDISLLTTTGLSILKGNDKNKPFSVDIGSLNLDDSVLQVIMSGILPGVAAADINGDGFADVIFSDDYRTGTKLNIIYGGIHFR